MKHLFFILIAFLFIGCRDGSGDAAKRLPPETQTGANTFGCLVNGKLFYPRDGIGRVDSNSKAIVFSESPSGYEYKELDVNNFIDGKPLNNFVLHFEDFNGVREYNWKQSNFNDGLDGVRENYLLVRAFNYNEGIWKWYGSYENSGKTIVTKYENGIFSGTFSGKLKTQDGKDEIEITNGRFDFNLFTLDTKEWP